MLLVNNRQITIHNAITDKQIKYFPFDKIDEMILPNVKTSDEERGLIVMKIF